MAMITVVGAAPRSRRRAFVVSDEAMGNRLGLHCREQDVAAIRDDDRPGPAPVRRVDERPFVPGILDDPFDGSGVGRHDGDDAIGRHDVAKPDVDQLELVAAVLHRRSSDYSTFCTCSRKLSSSPLMAITALVISRSLAFDPRSEEHTSELQSLAYL